MSTVLQKDCAASPDCMDSLRSAPARNINVAILTGGSDKPYVYGLTRSLLAHGVVMDLIGSDELNVPEFHQQPGLTFLKLRGDQRSDATLLQKARRILSYYALLIRYAATAKPKVFHVLWNNKFEFFDRTVLMLYYKSIGKKIVRTVHNVNAGKRDGTDTIVNRLGLRIQYRLAHHLFVHTAAMKRELTGQFGVPATRVTVIPFGINNAVPHTELTPGGARRRLGLGRDQKVILFFGRITPYKGLEYLIDAFRKLWQKRKRYQLIIAGRPDRCDNYWNPIRKGLRQHVENGDVLLRSDFIPDEEVEIYFKAADALVLPYRDIYQSGVLFLAHSFGLPVLAADVGSLRDDIIEGETGSLFRPEDPIDLANAIERYFESDLYANLNERRPQIRADAAERHSWDVVGQETIAVYAGLLRAAKGKNSW